MKNKYVFSSTALDNEKFTIGALMVKNIGYNLYAMKKDYIVQGFAYGLVSICKKFKKLLYLKKVTDITIDTLIEVDSLTKISPEARNKGSFPTWAIFTKDTNLFDEGPKTQEDEIGYNIQRIYYVGHKALFAEYLNNVLNWFDDNQALEIFNDYVKNIPVAYYFNLNKLEAEAVLISYYIWTTDLLDKLWGPLIRDDIRPFMDSILKPLCKKSYKDFNLTIKELLKKHIFTKNGYFCITDEIRGIMEMNSLDDIIRQCFDRVQVKSTYDLNTFNVNKENVDIMKNLITADMPSNVLVYGSAGTGKTEFTKALIVSLGKEAYTFNHSVFSEQQKQVGDGDDDRDLNYLEYLSLILSLGLKNKILIIDEADRMLSTKPTSFSGETNLKSFMNQMLDANRCKVIWITNNVNQIDNSTKRRFTYSLHFNKLNNDVIRKSIEKEFKELKLKKELMDKIVSTYLKYDTTMASLKYVKNIVANVSKMKTVTSDKELLSTVKNVLSSNQTLLNRSNKKQQKTEDKTYSLDVLNIDSDVNEIIEMVENSLEYRNSNPEMDNSVKILFYGTPGTGKSALATYLAERLNKEILKMHTSDILNKYVGETEQNIKNFFKEAEETDKVLLIDEVDSFISDRSGASRSWERTQVNEFLTQMDDYRGILVCTTNLLDIIDPAIKRRFHIIVKFNAMNEKGIKILCNNYFKEFGISENQISKLVKYDTITPADFSTLYSRLRFTKKAKLNSDYIIAELCKMQDVKSNNKPIGFYVL